MRTPRLHGGNPVVDHARAAGRPDGSREPALELAHAEDDRRERREHPLHPAVEPALALALEVAGKGVPVRRVDDRRPGIGGAGHARKRARLGAVSVDQVGPHATHGPGKRPRGPRVRRRRDRAHQLDLLDVHAEVGAAPSKRTRHNHLVPARLNPRGEPPDVLEDTAVGGLGDHQDAGHRSDRQKLANDGEVA